MINYLERVTKLAEECGCFPIGIPADIHSTMIYQFTKEQLLAFEQAVLAKRDEEHDSLVGQLESECDDLAIEVNSLNAKLAMQAEKLEQISCLGNGGTHGNSIGNQMAIEALNATQADVDNWMAKVRAKAVGDYIQQQRDCLVPKQVG